MPFWVASTEATVSTSAPAFAPASFRQAAEPFMPSSRLSKAGFALRPSARSQHRALEPATDSCKDEELHLASPGGCRAIRFLEWTPNDHLRHTALSHFERTKTPRAVVNEDETSVERKALRETALIGRVNAPTLWVYPFQHLTTLQQRFFTADL